jgi:GNAT superfamily N-acetyltransferase
MDIRSLLKVTTVHGPLSVFRGDVEHDYWTNDDPPKHVGFIQFSPIRGQIGFFTIESEFRHKGLGKQMLARAVDDIAAAGKATHVWAVAAKAHAFWSNVWNNVFSYRDPADDSVSGDGYAAELDNIHARSRRDFHE